MNWRTEVIYVHPTRGKVLWATRDSEPLAIVECIETGRLPIVHCGPYSPSLGPEFDVYDDELASDSRTEVPAAPRLEVIVVESDSSPGTFYQIETRADTKNGGTYLFCSCASWPFMKGKGQDCKHIKSIR